MKLISSMNFFFSIFVFFFAYKIVEIRIEKFQNFAKKFNDVIINLLT